MKAKTIKVGGVPEHFNLPWHRAIENGSFEAKGLDLQFTEYGGGTGALTKALRSKELDVAVVLTEGIVADILNGNPSKIVKSYVESPLIWGIHVPAKSDLMEVNDMQSQRYAISRFGSGSHLMAIIDAVERGWDTDIEFVKVGGLQNAIKALSEGEAEVFLWEKFMTKPYVDAGIFRRIGERLTPWPCFMIAVREEVLQQSPDEIKAMLKVINQTCQEMMDNSQETILLISQRFELQIEDVADWLSRTHWSTDFKKPKKALQKVLIGLKKAGIAKDGKVKDVWMGGCAG